MTDVVTREPSVGGYTQADLQEDVAKLGSTSFEIGVYDSDVAQPFHEEELATGMNQVATWFGFDPADLSRCMMQQVEQREATVWRQPDESLWVPVPETLSSLGQAVLDLTLDAMHPDEQYEAEVDFQLRVAGAEHMLTLYGRGDYWLDFRFVSELLGVKIDPATITSPDARKYIEEECQLTKQLVFHLYFKATIEQLSV